MEKVFKTIICDMCGAKTDTSNEQVIVKNCPNCSAKVVDE